MNGRFFFGLILGMRVFGTAGPNTLVPGFNTRDFGEFNKPIAVYPELAEGLFNIGITGKIA